MPTRDGDELKAAGEGDAPLRALSAANDEIEALRTGSPDPATARGMILRVANAVDRSLRRMLRDHEPAELALRLKALAPDELRIDAVLAELRRTERLPMQLAASVHELFEVRRRLDIGGEPLDADRTRAVRVADLLRREINLPHKPTAAPAARASDPPSPAETPPLKIRSRHRPPVPKWAFGALGVFLLAAVTVWAVGRNSGESAMEQGVSLFESGNYAESAQYFWRYSQENPEDSTPHLYLARIHRRMDRPELAAEALRQAQALAPEDPAVHRELGFLLLDTGRPDVAVDRFRHAIELDDQSTEGWVGLVRALRESGRAEDVPAVIAQAPAEAQALLSRPDSLLTGTTGSGN